VTGGVPDARPRRPAVPELCSRGITVALDRPLVMGVVNATVDSFSDGGRYSTPESRLSLVDELVGEGADILDVGGQSAITSEPEIPAAEEIDAILPILDHLGSVHPDVMVSVDTYRPPVAAAALAAGAHIINDISGLLQPELAGVVAAHEAALVVMHNRSRPKTRLTDPAQYADVVADVVGYLREKVAEAEARGVGHTSIIVDPGPDFSKTPYQTVTVLQHLQDVRALGYPVLVPISRKDFIGAITLRPPHERLAGTLAAVGFVGSEPGTIFRVHDVRAVRDFLLVSAVLGGDAAIAEDLMLPVELRRTRPAG